MNENPIDSLISAYFDGELHDADRQAVDKRLADDADARRELADYGQLSGLLRDLDRSVLPEEFTAQVMQHIERRTLLPQPQSVPRRRVWGWSALVPLAATAAVLLLMWAYPRTDSDQPLVATSEDIADGSGGLGGGARGSMYFNDTDVRDGFGGLGLGEIPLERQAGGLSAGPAAAAAPKTFNRASDAPAEPAANRAMVSSFGFRSPVQDFEVGSVIEAIETSPTKITVVKLWVVDRQEGLDKLQLLLARNDVVAEDEFASTNGVVVEKTAADKQAQRAESAETASDERQKLKAESLQRLDGVSTSDGLVAIYVEAPGQKLAEVLKGLQSDHAFVEVNTQPELRLLTQLDRRQARTLDSWDNAGNPGTTKQQSMGRRNVSEETAHLGDRGEAKSGLRKQTDALPSKPGLAPSRPANAAGPVGGVVAGAKPADEVDSKRDVSVRSRSVVIDDPVVLREVIAADEAESLVAAKKSEAPQGPGRDRAEQMHRFAKKSRVAEDAKALGAKSASTGNALRVIFLVEQGPPRK